MTAPSASLSNDGEIQRVKVGEKTTGIGPSKSRRSPSGLLHCGSYHASNPLNDLDRPAD